MRRQPSFFLNALSLLLIVSLFAASLSTVSAEAENSSSADERTEESSPTPDPHMDAWYEPVETDAIEGWPAAPSIEAKAAVVIDLQNGGIIYSKNADRKLYPASITKIMTCLLACEMLDMDTEFQMSESAAFGIEAGSSSIYGSPGETFTVDQAMMGLMLASANEMALALGELSCGSVKKFVEKMNARARAIGCTGTHFNNPNGLPDERHYTTAGDMAKIAYACWVNPLFRHYVTTGYYEIPPTNLQKETRYLQNHHKMMAGREYAYEGVLGGKTGYTIAAGNTLITYAERGNMSVAVALLGGIAGAWEDTRTLLDYTFDNFTKAAMWNLPRDTDSIKNKKLPCEKYILRNLGDVRPFYTAENRVYVTIPNSVKATAVKRKATFTQNYAGMPYLINRYYYEGHPVGTVKVYERKIMEDILIRDPFGS